MKPAMRFGIPIVAFLLLAGTAFFIVQNFHGSTRKPSLQESASDTKLVADRAAPAIGSPVPHATGITRVKAPSTKNAHAVAVATTIETKAGGALQAKQHVTTGKALASSADTASLLHPKRILAHGISQVAETSHPYFLESATASNGYEYGITRNKGLFVSTDGGKSWEERSNGLPLRVIYPFKDDPIETLTSLGVDPRHGRRVAVTTETGIYVSEDAGLSWRSIPVHKPIKNPDFITAVALSPFSPSTIAIGTSFAGYFVTTNDGKDWIRHSDNLGFIDQGAGFYEEISGLSYSGEAAGVLYIGVGFGGGVYRSGPDGKSWLSLDFPAGNKEVICNLNIRIANPHATPSTWRIEVTTQSKRWSYDPGKQAWSEDGAALQPPPPSPAAEARMKDASGRSGIYISPWRANGARLAYWISFLKANGLNTLVVDVKDDHGHITYNTQVPLAHALGAVHPYFDIQNLVRTAHQNGIYIVARLVVFKDEFLYRYENHRYAIWDPARDAPWGHFVREVDKKTGKIAEVQKEFWVDPFSEFAWRYNISIAKELQNDGVDEIQFDYIRFPSEKSSRNAFYRFRKTGMTEEAALESFLKLARGELHIPIAVDLFGYNSWYPITGWVGQDIEVYSNYADVICPMFYPSLFPRDFLSHMQYLERAKYLYRMGIWRSQRIIDGRAIVRPFVQAFLLGSYERNMDKAAYSDYLRAQLEGVDAAHATGFMLWNFGTDYYMVTFPLTPYVPKLKQEAKTSAATSTH